MLASLAELGPDTAALLDLIDRQGDGDARAFLGRLDRGIADVERVTTRLRDAENRSRAMMGVIGEAVADLSRQLAGVRDIRMDVQDIATNTRLLCRRHGIIGRAVSVIATEIDIHTVRLGDATASVSDAIARLGGIEAMARDGDGGHDDRDMGGMLAAALAVVRHACQRTEEATVEGGDNARQLVELLGHVGSELARELAIRDVLEAAARTLAQRTPAAEPTPAARAILDTLLPDIAKRYTMASEREVHARFLLPGMATAAPPVVEDEDDDDGLF